MTGNSSGTSHRVIAEWLSQDQLEGSRRSITVGPDRVAVVIQDGRYQDPRIEERVETRDRLRRNVGGAKEIEVLSADLTPFTVTYELDDTSSSSNNPDAVPFDIPVLTSDGKVVTGQIRLTLSVSRDHPNLLAQQGCFHQASL